MPPHLLYLYVSIASKHLTDSGHQSIVMRRYMIVVVAEPSAFSETIGLYVLFLTVLQHVFPDFSVFNRTFRTWFRKYSEARLVTRRRGMASDG